MNRIDKVDRTELEPAKVGGPIGEVKEGDATAHPSMQSAKTKKELKAQEEADPSGVNVEFRGANAQANRDQARAEAMLPVDGNLDPNFEGTQPKLMEDGYLRVVPMQTLKEETAAADGETVEKQERDAGLVVGQSLTPLAVEEAKKEEEAEEETEEPEVEEDDGNMTVAELKEALDGADIAYPSSARKADLLKLYNENFE